MRPLALVLALALCAARIEAQPPIVFVPMYATPVARQLPVMLGAIAGAHVVEPPRALLGGYIEPGDVRAVDAWLEREAATGAITYVLSTDMLAYGGLDPSRVPGGVSTELAMSRLRVLENLRAHHPRAWIAAFGTVMRLEPTAVTPLGAAVHYDPIAQPPTWEYIWEYAQLHDPPLPAEAERAQWLRERIGEPILRAYLDTRARDRDVDLWALHAVAAGTLDRVVIGQDDAGPVGLHVKDVAALTDAVARLGIADRAAVEPGADELGLALVAHALARSIAWSPRVAVRYSMPNGGATQDPFEFAPIDVTIGHLITLCGGRRDDANPDVVLDVRVPHTDAAHDDELLDVLASQVTAGTSTAFVDLTFLTQSYAAQAAFVRRLIDRGLAGKLDAYASWNTDANSVGIALAETIAAGVGRRAGTYDRMAHAEFLANRYIEDYLYHAIVRPQVNADLAARGAPNHWYLSDDNWRYAQRETDALLRPRAEELLRTVFPQYRVGHLTLRLPWPRTFELETDVRLVSS